MILKAGIIHTCKNLSVVMYRKFRNVSISINFPPICPYFVGFRVGGYELYYVFNFYIFFLHSMMNEIIVEIQI